MSDIPKIMNVDITCFFVKDLFRIDSNRTVIGRINDNNYAIFNFIRPPEFKNHILTLSINHFPSVVLGTNNEFKLTKFYTENPGPLKISVHFKDSLNNLDIYSNIITLYIEQSLPDDLVPPEPPIPTVAYVLTIGNEQIAKIYELNGVFSYERPDGTVHQISGGSAEFLGDMLNKNIFNLARGVSDDHAVNLGQLNEAIQEEMDRATEVEDSINTKATKNAQDISSEINRATTAEDSINAKATKNAQDISSEINRATTAENNIQSQTNQNTSDITSETNRAKGAENNLQSQITQNTNNVATEKSRNDVQDTQITKNTNDLSSLKGAWVYIPATNFGTSTPTQQQLTDYTVSKGFPVQDGIVITNLFDSHDWRYDSVVSHQWQDQGQSEVGQADNTGKLGIVTGSIKKYQAYVNPDGTLSINELETTLNDFQTQLNNKLNNGINENDINVQDKDGNSILTNTHSDDGNGNIGVGTSLGIGANQFVDAKHEETSDPDGSSQVVDSVTFKVGDGQLLTVKSVQYKDPNGFIDYYNEVTLSNGKSDALNTTLHTHPDGSQESSTTFNNGFGNQMLQSNAQKDPDGNTTGATILYDANGVPFLIADGQSVALNGQQLKNGAAGTDDYDFIIKNQVFDSYGNYLPDKSPIDTVYQVGGTTTEMQTAIPGFDPDYSSGKEYTLQLMVTTGANATITESISGITLPLCTANYYGILTGVTANAYSEGTLLLVRYTVLGNQKAWLIVNGVSVAPASGGLYGNTSYSSITTRLNQYLHLADATITYTPDLTSGHSGNYSIEMKEQGRNSTTPLSSNLENFTINFRYVIGAAALGTNFQNIIPNISLNVEGEMFDTSPSDIVAMVTASSTTTKTIGLYIKCHKADKIFQINPRTYRGDCFTNYYSVTDYDMFTPLNVNPISTLPSPVQGSVITATIKNDIAFQVPPAPKDIYYLPSSINTSLGTVSIGLIGTSNISCTGNVSDVISLNDLYAYSVQEVVQTPGFVISVIIPVTGSFNQLITRVAYNNNSTHLIHIDIYNNVTQTWDTLVQHYGLSGYAVFTPGIAGYQAYVSNGTVQVRYYHVSPGVTAHTYEIDYVALVQTQQGSQGQEGEAATIKVGTTTTGAAGTNANVINVGTSNAAVFNFTIPQGAQGVQGIQGVPGGKGDKGDTGDTGAQGIPGLNASGDMAKSIYDTNNNGIVDNAEKLGGQTSSYYTANSSLAAVAKSGLYSDLTGTPTIPPTPSNGQTEYWTGYFWQDGSGKKTYRKWVKCVVASGTSAQTFAHGIANLLDKFFVYGYLNQASGVSLPVPGFIPGTATNGITIQVDNTNISITMNGVGRPGTAWILLEYCCTDR